MKSFMHKFANSNEAIVMIAKIERPQVEVAALARVLSPEEMARAQRFVFDIHRHRFIVARALLRQHLGEYLNVAPCAVTFDYNAYGKPGLTPELYQASRLEFNLSHSENWAAFVFALEDPVGIDIELIKDDLEFDNIAKRFFSKEEAKKLASLPDIAKSDAFFNAWTRKEALLKALGQGLSFPLKNCEVTLLADEPTKILTIEGSEQKAATFSIFSFTPAPFFKGAVISTGADKRFRVIKEDH